MTREPRRAAASILLVAAALAAETRALTILHTNDLHARISPDSDRQGGFAVLAAVLRKETEGCNSCLILNAGDLVQGTPASSLYQGQLIFDLANLLHFDAATLGNHDLDYGFERTRAFIKSANYPIVSANLADAAGKLLTPEPYVIKTVNGIRVAIIGAMLTRLMDNSLRSRVGPYSVLPVAETVRKYAKEVREKADFLVVLGHLDAADQTAILRGVPEVQVLVTGHDHAGLSAPDVYEGRVDVRVKGYGVEAGRLAMKVDVSAKKLESWNWHKIPVDGHTVKPAPDVAAQVDAWEKKIAPLVDIRVGEAKREFTRTELRAMLERAMVEITKADFGFMNAGGVRDKLPKGRILVRDLWNIMPFENQVVVARFKGSQLGQFAKAGHAIDPARDYTVAMPDFVAEHQEALIGAAGQVLSKDGPLVRDALIEWVKKQRMLE
ncbi:MAG: bifunctional metallophosphatase/5'-nucleotidase [Bryobacterales bacterium]|nr:bifunctional metallophosphatase/5'-nucleotidase [Bryobacterales bacterium]